ncbi:hypothetical protein B0H66DRAFT_373886 [Apodospora peruviana]|uniref:Uncharacterized protein n=1 Tax=Apodospora peruviana TaxID=516989 RepID=A0AAE0M0B3_9PEZI|nr:hypothetical protein B0H66DRAFT_373886 [Apodospora peruviana]
MKSATGCALGLLLLARLAISQDSQGCGNVTISSSADADAIRKSCKTITGNVAFSESFARSPTDVSLDGVEVIEGNIWHDTHDDLVWCGEPTVAQPTDCPGPWSLSSGTLREVGGNIYTWAFPGLWRVSLPSLQRVGKAFSLNRMNYLRELDVTALEVVESFTLGAEVLEKFSLKELKAFSGPRNGWVNLYGGGKVEDFDGLFRANLDPWHGWTGDGPDVGSFMASNTGTQINAPSIKRLTFGWRRIPSLRVMTESDVTFVLGGPNSTEVEIGELHLGYGVRKVERGETVKKLSVGLFELRNAARMETLDLPFDQLGTLEVRESNALTRVVLPAQAEDWKDWSVQITGSPNVDMKSEYADEAKTKKTWYWPKGDIESIWLSGNISTDFFASFLQQRSGPSPPQVKTFALSDTSGELDCGVFKEAQTKSGNKTFTGDYYECYSVKNAAYKSLPGGLLWQVVLAAGAVVALTMAV